MVILKMKLACYNEPSLKDTPDPEKWIVINDFTLTIPLMPGDGRWLTNVGGGPWGA